MKTYLVEYITLLGYKKICIDLFEDLEQVIMQYKGIAEKINVYELSKPTIYDYKKAEIKYE